MNGINWWAVIAAALSSFLLGGLWYSPALFGRIWNIEARRGANMQTGHPARVFGGSFLLALGAAAVFAVVIGPQPSFSRAVSMGCGLGSGLVATSFGINYLFASRSLRLWLIDGGYHVAQFTIYGVILGLWH